MADLLFSLDQFSLSASGPVLTCNLEVGQLIAIIGASGSGKSYFLETIRGSSQPKRGSYSGTIEPHFVSPLTPSRRTKLQSIAFPRGNSRTKEESEFASKAMDALDLWSHRRKTLAELSSGQLRNAAILQALATESRFVALDEDLDSLDPVAFARLLPLLKDRAQSGASFLFVTNRPDLIENANFIIGFRQTQIAFAGTPLNLTEQYGETELTVETDNVPVTKALCDGFEIEVIETEKGLKLVAREGQKLAAKLLLEGYGDVKFIIQKQLPFAESLARMLS